MYIEVQPISGGVAQTEEHGQILLDLSSSKEIIGIEILGIPEVPEIVVHDVTQEGSSNGA